MIHKMHEFWLSLLLRFPKSNESLDSQLNAENATCMHYTVSASFSLQTVHAGKFPPLKPGAQGRELQKSSSCLFAYICWYASSFSNTQLSLISAIPHSQILLHAQVCQRRKTHHLAKFYATYNSWILQKIGEVRKKFSMDVFNQC